MDSAPLYYGNCDHSPVRRQTDNPVLAEFIMDYLFEFSLPVKCIPLAQLPWQIDQSHDAGWHQGLSVLQKKTKCFLEIAWVKHPGVILRVFCFTVDRLCDCHKQINQCYSELDGNVSTILGMAFHSHLCPLRLQLLASKQLQWLTSYCKHTPLEEQHSLLWTNRFALCVNTIQSVQGPWWGGNICCSSWTHVNPTGIHQFVFSAWWLMWNLCFREQGG